MTRKCPIHGTALPGVSQCPECKRRLAKQKNFFLSREDDLLIYNPARKRGRVRKETVR